MTNRVWVRSGGKLKTIIESFDELRWTRRYNQLGDMFLRVPRVVDGAQYLVGALGDEISVVDDPDGDVPDLTFIIERLDFSTGEGGLKDDMVEVRGIEAGLFHARVALPPPHELPLGGASHHIISGDAETAMREIVDNNVGPSAPSQRQYPGLVMATNQNRGVTREWKARFETVIEKLTTWAETSDLGFEVQYDAANDEHVFTVLEGEDKSAKVEFSIRLDNVEAQEWLRNGSDQLSFAWVAGQGEGVVRDMAGVHTGASEPEGRDRREMFLDARDLESETDLPTRGEEKLAARRIEESLSVDLADVGPFAYKSDFDLGDTVTVKNAAWNMIKAARITAVTTRVKSARVQRELTIGRAPKDLQTRISEAIGDKATARSVQKTPANASGGTETEITEGGVDYRVHTFTSSGVLTVDRSGDVEYLILAGGGGGGKDSNEESGEGRASGGGAGGLLIGTTKVLKGTHDVTVGLGGAGGTGGSPSEVMGGQGGDSKFNGITAYGGGGGGGTPDFDFAGSQVLKPRDGGCGGGGQWVGRWQGFGTPGQGEDGGFVWADYFGDGGVFSTGGGGGTSEKGQDATSTANGKGGDGTSSSINGTSTVYGGGGGSVGDTSVSDSSGGAGGGGDGGGHDGTDGLGGGGGGRHFVDGGPDIDAGDGGDGIVIIRYRI